MRRVSVWQTQKEHKLHIKMHFKLTILLGGREKNIATCKLYFRITVLLRMRGKEKEGKYVSLSMFAQAVKEGLCWSMLGSDLIN